MLVLSRKKSESILIDGVIRIDVVAMTKATVRLRLMAPKSLSVNHGMPSKETRPREDSAARICPVGVSVFHLTLVNQQIVTLGDSFKLGVVDADKYRVLFFVDVPEGTSVSVLDPQQQDRKTSSAEQNLLPFMGHGIETPGDVREQPPVTSDSRADPSAHDNSGPDLLPFPSPLPKRDRI